ncbi:MAG: CBS domain-containing protein [Desulfuromusa sp.]|nr:CBS domain-containing protein [Desulfuromusa sp.]
MVKTADKRRDSLQKLEEPLVKDFMNTDIVIARSDMTFKEVVNLLLKKRISNLPVVRRQKGENLLVGLISERDCLTYLAQEIFYGAPSITLEAAMKHIPICVSPGTDLFTVSSIFTQQGYRHLPVIKKGNILVGVISRCDVLRGLNIFHEQYRKANEAERKTPDLRKILLNRRLMIK